jgi:hypothetical protein
MSLKPRLGRLERRLPDATDARPRCVVFLPPKLGQPAPRWDPRSPVQVMPMVHVDAVADHLDRTGRLPESAPWERP